MSLRNVKPHKQSKPYAPTLVAVANVDGVPAGVLKYSVTGRTVRVWGQVSVDPTAGATLTSVGIPLPHGFDVVASTDVSGQATRNGAENGEVVGDTTNNRAQLNFVSDGTDAELWQVSFSYQMAK